MVQTSKISAFPADIFLQDDQTIIAQCTPRGSGALALLRLSGCSAVTIAAAMSKLAGTKKLIDQPTHTIHYASIVDANGGTIDQVLLFLMHAPHTFTGQDTVEISCHNNQFIVQAIIAQAIALGARSAQEGEFTRRAVLNKKIDVIQAEAINELINANTQLALKKSLAQLNGSFSSWVAAIEQELYKAFAFSESSFEFIDEEMQFGDQIKAIIETTISTIATLKSSFNQQQQIRQGIRVALIGAVNAGKSSLFNALLQKDRAIVTNIAGTTRDSIEAGVYKNGNYWTLIDTAGLRQTNDVIEQKGISRSFDEAAQADIIILVIDQARAMSEEELKVYTEITTAYEGKIIVVGNKCDLLQLAHQPFKLLSISTTTLHNINVLESAIEQKIATLFSSLDSPFLLNQRQFNLLLELEKKLSMVLPMLNDSIAYELLSYHLKDALENLAELTGKSISEQGMDTIFREFCIGK